MEENYKGILAINKQEDLASLIEALTDKSNFELLACFNNGHMLKQTICKLEPDFLLLDLNLKGCCAVDILLNPGKDTKILVACQEEDDIAYQLARKHKVDLITCLSTDKNQLIDQIEKACQCPDLQYKLHKTQKQVVRVLTDLGLDINTRGFTYIKDSLVYTKIEEETDLVVKIIFAQLCKKHGTSLSSIYYHVENTINKAWPYPLKDKLKEKLGYQGISPPTSFELIHLIHDFIS